MWKKVTRQGMWDENVYSPEVVCRMSSCITVFMGRHRTIHALWNNWLPKTQYIGLAWISCTYLARSFDWESFIYLVF